MAAAQGSRPVGGGGRTRRKFSYIYIAKLVLSLKLLGASQYPEATGLWYHGQVNPMSKSCTSGDMIDLWVDNVAFYFDPPAKSPVVC